MSADPKHDVNDSPGAELAAALDERRRKALLTRKRLRLHEMLWSWTRLVVFAAGIYGVWVVHDSIGTVVGVLAAAGVAFGWAIRVHTRVSRERAFHDDLLTVIDESASRHGGRIHLVRRNSFEDWAAGDSELPTRFAAGGAAPLTVQEIEDIDFFAEPVGIFGLTNRTSTPWGERRLCHWLTTPSIEPQAIESRQGAVRFLANDTKRRLAVLASLAGFRRLERWAESLPAAIELGASAPLSGRGELAMAWSLLSGVFSLVAMGTALMGEYTLLVPLLLLMGIHALWLRSAKDRLQPILRAWSDLGSVVTQWNLAAKNVLDTNIPANGPLSEQKRILRDLADSDVLPRIRSLCWWADTGGMVRVLLNQTMLYDLMLARGLHRRLADSGTLLEESLGVLTDLDALASLACFAAEQHTAAFPSIAPAARVDIRGFHHPLVEPAVSVPNDLVLDEQATCRIITGANMAGKSTYLRCAGICVVLAQAGGAVPAAAMSWRPVHLVSDLRIRDDLSRKESYFLAEVRQLRRLMDEPGDVRILGLVDEPFRGTNSHDRIAASLAVAEEVVLRSHFLLLATHEPRLTELGDLPAVSNWHFSEDLAETGPVFDYLLRSGPATTRNALKILEREQFPPRIIERAEAMQATLDEESAG